MVGEQVPLHVAGTVAMERASVPPDDAEHETTDSPDVRGNAEAHWYAAASATDAWHRPPDAAPISGHRHDEVQGADYRPASNLSDVEPPLIHARPGGDAKAHTDGAAIDAG